MLPFFSIVIPTLNEEKCLPKLLKNLKEQTFTDFEILHVDGNSSDDTIKEAAKFQKHLNLTSFTVDKQNVSFQRNYGSERAKGQWIIFMDADTGIPHYFLQGLKYQLEKNPETDIFSCLINTKEYPLSDRPLVEIMNIGFELHAKFAPVAVGALLGIRAKLCEVFSFDEKLPMGEDHDLLMSIIEKGHTFNLFKEPGYLFSLRRFKKDNTLKLFKAYLQSNLYFLSNKQLIKALPNYPMLGGSYYDEEEDSPLHDLSRSPKHRWCHQKQNYWSLRGSNVLWDW